MESDSADLSSSGGSHDRDKRYRRWRRRHDDQHDSNSSLTKTGRRGDPRMHRAVAARLADHSISLFEALRRGGFDYPNDDTSNIVDSENVTLGQRKNQLSRRVRMARRQKQHMDSQCQEDNGDQSDIPPKQGSDEVSGRTGPSAVKRERNPSSSLKEDSGLISKVRHRLTSDYYDYNCLESDGNGESASAVHTNGKMTKFHHSFSSTRKRNRDTIHQNKVDKLDPIGYSQASNSLLEKKRAQEIRLHDHLEDTGRPTRTTKSTSGRLERVTPRNLSSDDEESDVGVDTTFESPPRVNNYRKRSALSATSETFGHMAGSKDKGTSSLEMALDQLSAALQNCRIQTQLTLQDIGKRNGFSKAKQELAMGLYQAENRALYQRAMLLTGYPPDSALNECISPEYLQFALNCWHAEGQRLQKLLVQQNREGTLSDLQQKKSSLAKDNLSRQQSERNSICQGNEFEVNQESRRTETASFVGGKSKNTTKTSFSENSKIRSEFYDNNNKNNKQAVMLGLQLEGDACENAHNAHGCALANGRHIHRLEGKCGHKAILHIPEDGPAHIDFMVGDKVECYQGMQPLSFENSANTASWPSAYNCEEVSCAGMCGDERLNNHEHSDKCQQDFDPKILHLDEIDMDSKEWNLDFSNGETVLGLFKLGDSNAATNEGSIPESL